MNKPECDEMNNLRSLKQAADQINSVIEMLETSRRPLDIARKLNSLEKEICRLKRAFVNEHHGMSVDSGGRLPLESLPP